MTPTARSKWRLLPLVIVLSMVIAACGGDDDESSTGTTAAAQANPNAELKVGFTEDQYITQATSTNDVNVGVYPLNMNISETLVLFGTNYELKPLLAERWEFRAPNTWRFFIRRGVTFHDGQPLNANTVKAGLFDRLARVLTNGGTVRAGPNSAVVVDEYTLDFTSLVTNYRVPEQLVHPQNGVFAPGSDFSRKPVGTGAFKFVSYAPKETIVAERNDTYWGQKAGVAKITARFYPDSNARRLALEAGDVDVIYQVPAPDVKGLKSRGFTIQNSAVGAYEAMFANIKGTGDRDILSDVNVRKAVALAVDRKALVDGVLEGQGSADQTVIPPGALGSYASAIKGFTTDLAQARTLLDNAGWRVGSDGIREKSGRKLKLRLISGFPAAEVHRPIPTFLQAQLKNVGIDVEIIETPDSPAYTDRLTAKDGDLYLEQGNQNDANPAFLPGLLWYSGPETSGGNYQPIIGPGVDSKFDQLLKPVFTEPDRDKVQKATADAVHEIVDNVVAIIPLNGIFRIYGMKKSVQGFQPHFAFLQVRWEGVTVTA
ncbi:MAG: ABC transporter substrate-binding protein [Acidimicrobiales bacterium]